MLQGILKQSLNGRMLGHLYSCLADSMSDKVWQEYVREDLTHLNMPYNWHKVAQKREVWRRKISFAHIASLRRLTESGLELEQ